MKIHRTILKKALQHIDNDRIMLFVGARQTGKTTILHALEKIIATKGCKTFFLNLEDPEYLQILNEHPKNIFTIFPIDLSKKTTIFIDEIQYLSHPSNFLKYLFDEYKGKIKLIISGSSAFYINQKFSDSLAGRKTIFYVRPLSFSELLRFRTTKECANKSFSSLTQSEKRQSNNTLDEYMMYGGYPAITLAPIDQKQEMLREIIYSYVKKDIFETGVRDSATFFKLLKILAEQSGNLVNTTKLANTLDVSKTAINNYLHIMQKSFHITLITPSNVRKELTKMPKVYFYDNGLRNFLLSNFDNIAIRKNKESLLENTVFCMLLEKYHETDIHFWRTTTANEVDFIIGNHTAYEVKSSPKKMNLLKYKVFHKNYPNINFSFVSTNCTSGTKIEKNDIPCKDLREL